MLRARLPYNNAVQDVSQKFGANLQYLPYSTLLISSKYLENSTTELLFVLISKQLNLQVTILINVNANIAEGLVQVLKLCPDSWWWHLIINHHWESG